MEHDAKTPKTCDSMFSDHPPQLTQERGVSECVDSEAMNSTEVTRNPPTTIAEEEKATLSAAVGMGPFDDSGTSHSHVVMMEKKKSMKDSVDGDKIEITRTGGDQKSSQSNLFTSAIKNIFGIGGSSARNGEDTEPSNFSTHAEQSALKKKKKEEKRSKKHRHHDDEPDAYSNTPTADHHHQRCDTTAAESAAELCFERRQQGRHHHEIASTEPTSMATSSSPSTSNSVCCDDDNIIVPQLTTTAAGGGTTQQQRLQPWNAANAAEDAAFSAASSVKASHIPPHTSHLDNNSNQHGVVSPSIRNLLFDDFDDDDDDDENGEKVASSSSCHHFDTPRHGFAGADMKSKETGCGNDHYQRKRLADFDADTHTDDEVAESETKQRKTEGRSPSSTSSSLSYDSASSETSVCSTHTLQGNMDGNVMATKRRRNRKGKNAEEDGRLLNGGSDSSDDTNTFVSPCLDSNTDMEDDENGKRGERRRRRRHRKNHQRASPLFGDHNDNDDHSDNIKPAGSSGAYTTAAGGEGKGRRREGKRAFDHSQDSIFVQSPFEHRASTTSTCAAPSPHSKGTSVYDEEKEAKRRAILLADLQLQQQRLRDEPLEKQKGGLDVMRMLLKGIGVSTGGASSSAAQGVASSPYRNNGPEGGGGGDNNTNDHDNSYSIDMNVVMENPPPTVFGASLSSMAVGQQGGGGVVGSALPQSAARTPWQCIKPMERNVFAAGLIIAAVVYTIFAIASIVATITNSIHLGGCNSLIRACQIASPLFFVLTQFSFWPWCVFLIFRELPKRLALGKTLSPIATMLSTILCLCILGSAAISLVGVIASGGEDQSEEQVCGRPYMFTRTLSICFLAFSFVFVSCYMGFYTILNNRSATGGGTSALKDGKGGVGGGGGGKGSAPMLASVTPLPRGQYNNNSISHQRHGSRGGGGGTAVSTPVDSGAAKKGVPPPIVSAANKNRNYASISVTRLPRQQQRVGGDSTPSTVRSSAPSSAPSSSVNRNPSSATTSHHAIIESTKTTPPPSSPISSAPTPTTHLTTATTRTINVTSSSAKVDILSNVAKAKRIRVRGGGGGAAAAAVIAANDDGSPRQLGNAPQSGASGGSSSSSSTPRSSRSNSGGAGRGTSDGGGVLIVGSISNKRHHYYRRNQPQQQQAAVAGGSHNASGSSSASSSPATLVRNGSGSNYVFRNKEQQQ